MAQERLTVRKIREILRLKAEAGLSNRAIARACKISNSTVGEYVRRAEQAGLHWPLPEGISEDELYQKDDFSFRNLNDLERLKEEVISQIGFLRDCEGGDCVSRCLCDRDFACAGCVSFVPDPRRRAEIEEKIMWMKKVIEYLLHDENANELSVTVQMFRTHIKQWELVLAEINHLEELFDYSLETGKEYYRLLDRLDRSTESLFPELPSGILDNHIEDKNDNPN